MACRSKVTLGLYTVTDHSTTVVVSCDQEHVLIGSPIKYHYADLKSLEGVDVKLSWEEEIYTPINYVQVT